MVAGKKAQSQKQKEYLVKKKAVPLWHAHSSNVSW